MPEPPAEELSADDFWQIIERTRAEALDQQLALVQDELAQLNARQLIEFQKRFTELKHAAYHWDIWLIAWLCQGGLCSDDGFSDFRNWLISRGRGVYEMALREPDALVNELRRAEYPEFELLGYAAQQAYSSRTGRELADLPELALQHPQDPAGGDWLGPELKDRSGSHMLNRCVVFGEMGSQEYAEIERRFPRTWRYCLEQGIIKVGQDAGRPPEAGERLPTAEEVARSKVNPNLAQTDFSAYLKALADAAQDEYRRRKPPE